MTDTRTCGPRPRTCCLLGAAVLLAHAAVLGPLSASRVLAAPAPQPAAPVPAAITLAPAIAWAAAPQEATQALQAVPAPAPASIRVKPQTAAPRAPAVKHTAATPAPAPADGETALQLAQASPPAGSKAGPAPAAAPAASAPPSDPPPSAELRYEVSGQAKGFGYSAQGSLSWRREGPNYEARMELAMPLLGKRVQTSRGSIGPDGLRPTRFADLRKGERAAHFEAEARRIRFSNNAPDAEWLPGAQDRLSLFLQLGGLLRAQPRQTGDVLSFQVAGVGDAEVWRFEVGPLETLSLPAGQIEARLLRRAARQPHDTTVEVWLAPSMNHLPVRLRITQENGDVADQRLAQRP